VIELDVNGRSEPVPAASVEELERRIARSIGRGAVVWRVRVDGRELPEPRLSGLDLSRVRSVEVESAPLDSLARDAVADTIERIESACARLAPIAAGFREGNVGRAARLLLDEVDSLELLLVLLGGVHAFVPVDAARAGELRSEWRSAEAALRAALGGMLDGLAARDAAQLAERTEHSLPRALARFRALLERITP
jgi:hypothetical protein